MEKEARKYEVINSPQKYLDIISKFSTVTKLGDECEVLDWKTASQEVFKPVGNWRLKFKLCKRFILRRSKRVGNVLVGGHLHYKTDLMESDLMQKCLQKRKISLHVVIPQK